MLELMKEKNEDAWCCVCFTNTHVDQFKVLGCGHYFCTTCLEEWFQQTKTTSAISSIVGGENTNENGTTFVECPQCRTKEHKDFLDLSSLEEFEGKVFVTQAFNDDEIFSFENIFHDQLKLRSQTVSYLRFCAMEIFQQEKSSSIAKVVGSSAGLAGSITAIVGLTLCLTGVGAIVGAPLAITGAVVGGSGGLTVGGTIGTESLLKHHTLVSINKHMNEDYFKATQIRILLGRASKDEHFATKFGVNPEDASSLVRMIFGMGKLGLVLTARMASSIAYSATRIGVNTGLHVAGIIFSAVLIPIDLAQLIISSIKLHNDELSQIVYDIRRKADEFEYQLYEILIEKRFTFCEIIQYNTEKSSSSSSSSSIIIALRSSDIEAFKNSFSPDIIEDNHDFFMDFNDGDLDLESSRDEGFVLLKCPFHPKIFQLNKKDDNSVNTNVNVKNPDPELIFKKLENDFISVSKSLNIQMISFPPDYSDDWSSDLKESFKIFVKPDQTIKELLRNICESICYNIHQKLDKNGNNNNNGNVNEMTKNIFTNKKIKCEDLEIIFNGKILNKKRNSRNNTTLIENKIFNNANIEVRLIR